MVITKKIIKNGIKFLFSLNILDIFTTIIFLSLGVLEGNPLISWLIDFNITFTFIFKLLLFSFMLFIMYLGIDLNIRQLKILHIRKMQYHIILFLNLVYFLIIFQNLRLIIITI